MQIKTLHCYKNYQYNATCKSKHYTTIKTTNIMQHANQNITLHYKKNYQYNATCKSKNTTIHCNYKTTIKTTNIMQHANQNITLL